MRYDALTELDSLLHNSKLQSMFKTLGTSTSETRVAISYTVKPGYKGTGYKGYLVRRVQTQVQIFLGVFFIYLRVTWL
jgi:hypothetical protein